MTVAQAVTETEYWQKYYYNSEKIYEWNNGYLQEKPMSDYLTYLMYKWFVRLLDNYLTVHPIAEFTGLEMGFRLVLPNKIDIRRPDLGVVLNNNPVPLLFSDRTYQGTFDMCIEALSDSSTKEVERDIIIKKEAYAAAGVKEYFILYGYGEPMEFYRLNDNGVYETIERIDNVIRSNVLPEFQFRADDLHNQPSLEEMMEDQIYQNFILPNYQETLLSYEETKQNYQIAKQKIKAEAKRVREAEAEIARLKALLAAAQEQKK